MSQPEVLVDASCLDEWIETVSRNSANYMRIAENVDAVITDPAASRHIHQLVQSAYSESQQLLSQLRLLQRAVDMSITRHPSRGRVSLQTNVFLIDRTYGERPNHARPVPT